jgi:hypothetical protein
VSSYDSPEYGAWVNNLPDNPDALDVYYDVYMFSVTNHASVLFDGDKPVLTQLGPYRYREYFNRFNVTFSADRSEVAFYEQWYYVFDEEASSPRDDQTDEVTQMNLVTLGLKQLLTDNNDAITQALVAAINNSTEIPAFEKSKLVGKIEDVALSDLLTKASICLTDGVQGLNDGQFHTRSPRDLYFGYDHDPTLEALGDLLSKISPALSENWSQYSPGLSSNSTSEQYEMLNGNKHTVYTGYDDINKLGRFKYYQNMTHMYVCPSAVNNCPDTNEALNCVEGTCYCYKFQYEWSKDEAECHGYYPMFATDDANVIIGTDGTQTGQFPMKDDIQVFIDDLYRSSKLTFKGERDDFHGITLRRYGIDDRDLDNAATNASQADFYQFGYKGIENMTTAAGFPLFASKPHFLDADERLIDGVGGMNPNREHHDTFVDFEPITGVTFRAAKRLQVSTLYTPWDLPVFEVGLAVKEALKVAGHQDLVDVLNCLEVEVNYAKMNGGDEESESESESEGEGEGENETANATYIPYGWADEYNTFTDDDADEFKDQVYGTQALAASLAIYCGIASGGLFIMAGFGLLYRRKVRNEMLEEYGKMVELNRAGTNDSLGRWTRIGGEGRGSMGKSMKF